MKFDHVAVNVKDIKVSTDWYVNALGAEILYVDDTWAFLQAHGCKIALTLKSQHPAHICFSIDRDEKIKYFGDKVFKDHRDGSSSCYTKDPDGNFIEYLIWSK
jgi:catechol 2,3-dioxygenase-like lactoylglutathione lyase family enzyme